MGFGELGEWPSQTPPPCSLEDGGERRLWEGSPQLHLAEACTGRWGFAHRWLEEPVSQGLREAGRKSPGEGSWSVPAVLKHQSGPVSPH